jgi:hypothetical protein
LDKGLVIGVSRQNSSWIKKPLWKTGSDIHNSKTGYPQPYPQNRKNTPISMLFEQVQAVLPNISRLLKRQAASLSEKFLDKLNRKH